MIAATAAKIGRPEIEVRHVVDALEVVVCEDVRGGNTVVWAGMMKIEPVQRAERSGRNPATQETVTYPAKTVARISPYKDLKDAASGG